MSSSCPVQTASLTRLVSVALSLVVVLFLCITPQVRCGGSEEYQTLLNDKDNSQPSHIKLPKAFTLKLIHSPEDNQVGQKITPSYLRLYDPYGKFRDFTVNGNIVHTNSSYLHGIERGEIVLCDAIPPSIAFFPEDLRREDDGTYTLTYSTKGYRRDCCTLV